MTWFKVDDGFYDHPKLVGVNMSCRGLWVTAGAYCARHLTNGVISWRQIRSLGGTRAQVRGLVATGLWRAIVDQSGSESYAFHDWIESQPTKNEVLKSRERERDKKAKWREKKNQKQHDQQESENVHGGQDGHGDRGQDRPSTVSRPDPTRPDLSSTYVERGGLRSERASDPPTPRCPKHINDERPPACGACADARRAREAWDADEARSRSERQRFEREQQAADIRAEIDACELCDERGYVGGRVCDHDPEAAERNARGMAQVRAILGGGEIERAALTGGALAKCSHGRQIGGAE